MVIRQGDVVWADLPAPTGSGPGFRRPVLVVQGDPINRSAISTVICIPLTSQLRWADAPGNMMITAKRSGLPRDSVANVSQIVALDRALLSEPAGHVSPGIVERILSGLDVVLARHR